MGTAADVTAFPVVLALVVIHCLILALQPLVSHAVIFNLIAATTTATGLTVESYLDTGAYPAGQQISDVQMASQLTRDACHGAWNYTIAPRAPGTGQVDFRRTTVFHRPVIEVSLRFY